MFQLILLLAVIVTGAFTSADDEVKKKERERDVKLFMQNNGFMVISSDSC